MNCIEFSEKYRKQNPFHRLTLLLSLPLDKGKSDSLAVTFAGLFINALNKFFDVSKLFLSHYSALS